MGVSFSHLVSASDITRRDADFLMETAAAMKREMEERRTNLEIDRWRDDFKRKRFASLFYEPSTRTRFSFEDAMRNFGAGVVTADGFQFSSLFKGESIRDNTLIVAGYDKDLIAMRHPKSGSAKEAADALDEFRRMKGRHVPFINAGDGNNEHPTQALLDIFTIQEECRRLAGLHVALAGDLKNGRTVHSLTKLLTLYENVRFTFASPQELAMPDGIKHMLDEKKVAYREVRSIEDALDSDVLYMTRVQKERFPQNDEGLAEYERLKGAFVLNASMLAQRATVVMHPLPRVDELSYDVDYLKNGAYFSQAANGVAVRMALIHALLGVPQQQDETDKEYRIRVAGRKNAVYEPIGQAV